MSIMERLKTPPRTRHWRFSVEHYDQLLPPSPLAEFVEPELALAGMRHCMTLRKAEGHFHSAWHHVEYAMNQHIPELDDDIRRKYIGDASYLIATLTNLTGEQARRVSPNLYAQAMTLNIFLPVFTKRALSKQITAADCEAIYHSFGRLYEDLIPQTQDSDSSYKPARFAEMLGSCLSARSLQPELLLYPASPREESSPSQEHNHDGYFIRDSEKLPVQSKLDITDKRYRKPTNILYMEPIATHALKRAGLVSPDQLKFGDATLILSELVTRETVHGDIDAIETRALDFATRSIAGRYRFLFPDMKEAS